MKQSLQTNCDSCGHYNYMVNHVVVGKGDEKREYKICPHCLRNRKYCNTCKKWIPKIAFHSDVTKADKLSGSCGKCRNTKRRIADKKRRAITLQNKQPKVKEMGVMEIQNQYQKMFSDGTTITVNLVENHSSANIIVAKDGKAIEKATTVSIDELGTTLTEKVRECISRSKLASARSALTKLGFEPTVAKAEPKPKPKRPAHRKLVSTAVIAKMLTNKRSADVTEWLRSNGYVTTKKVGGYSRQFPTPKAVGMWEAKEHTARDGSTYYSTVLWNEEMVNIVLRGLK